MEVFTLKYDHRHGMDISVHKTVQGARNFRVEVILEWFQEVHHEATVDLILDSITKGEFEVAVNLWNKYQESTPSPEYFEIEEHEVLGDLDPDPAALMQRAQKEIADRKISPEG